MTIGQGNAVWRLAAPATAQADHGLRNVKVRVGVPKPVKVHLHQQSAPRAMDAEMPAGERG